MHVLPVSPDEPRADRIATASETLAAGGIVALPTETFYGLAADCFDGDALTRVNRLKGKPEGSPLLLLLADRGQAADVATDLPELFAALAERFWPGPLTLVVPAAPSLPHEVSGGRGTVALRVPGLALPRRVAQSLGHPISGVSANPTGEPPCRNALEVARAFPRGLDLILDGGPGRGGAPSTIVDLSVDPPRIVRRGLVPEQALAPFVTRGVRPL